MCVSIHKLHVTTGSNATEEESKKREWTLVFRHCSAL